MTAPLDLDALEAAARAAGGDTWISDDADGYVFGADGDSICICHPNIGHQPEPIFPDQFAEHIAAANPAVVLVLIERVRAAEAGEEHYRKLAGELRKQQMDEDDEPAQPITAPIIHTKDEWTAIALAQGHGPQWVERMMHMQQLAQDVFDLSMSGDPLAESTHFLGLTNTEVPHAHS